MSNMMDGYGSHGRNMMNLNEFEDQHQNKASPVHVINNDDNESAHSLTKSIL